MITTHQKDSTAIVMLAARAINPFSRLFQRELEALIVKLEDQRPQLKGVIIGFKSELAASGHELEHLMALTSAQAGDCMQMLGAYNALLRRLESLGAPVVAHLSGAVGGHALGLALACHHRIGLQDVRLSLAQVRLGLVPVAGEIARCARLCGLRAAMPLLLDGATLSAGQALQAGLLHAVAAGEMELAGQLRLALGDAGDDGAGRAPAVCSAIQPWDARGFHLPGGGLNSAPLQALLQAAPAMLREKTGGHYPAPEAILCAMVEGLQVDFDNALLIESRYFCQIAISPVARNLMRLGQCKKFPASPQALEFAELLHAAYASELRLLRAEGVSAAMLRNAARAAGMTQLPALELEPEPKFAPKPAAAGTAPQPASDDQDAADQGDGSSLPLELVRDRLLYAQVIAALASLERGVPASAAEADRISTRSCGFPAFTGGVIGFIRHIGADAFRRRAAALGPRFLAAPKWLPEKEA